MNFYARRPAARLAIKTLLLFLSFNLLAVAVDPLPVLGKLSLYGWLAPARSRLPYGEQPTSAYNLSLNNLDAMFAAHEIKQPKAPDEFRVVLLGDSSVWGLLLRPEQTLSASLNAAEIRHDVHRLRFYNLGYPVQSLTKDVLILDEARHYQPDLIVWLVTLEAFAPGQQFVPMLVRANADRLGAIPDLALNSDDEARLIKPTGLDRTLTGRRRDLADMLWLQVYGAAWAATGIDQVYLATFQPTMVDFKPDDFRAGLANWHGLLPDKPLTGNDLAFQTLRTGISRADGVPVLIVNEPIFVSGGLNSEVRYNYFYPRWAYDQYRDWMREVSMTAGWSYVDLWNAISPDQFTDSPVHLTPTGSRQLAGGIAETISTVLSQ